MTNIRTKDGKEYLVSDKLAKWMIKTGNATKVKDNPLARLCSRKRIPC